MQSDRPERLSISLRVLDFLRIAVLMLRDGYPGKRATSGRTPAERSWGKRGETGYGMLVAVKPEPELVRWGKCDGNAESRLADAGASTRTRRDKHSSRSRGDGSTIAEDSSLC